MRRFRIGNPERIYFQFFAEGFCFHRIGEAGFMRQGGAVIGGCCSVSAAGEGFDGAKPSKGFSARRTERCRRDALVAFLRLR
jgi:hypothetical protein